MVVNYIAVKLFSSDKQRRCQEPCKHLRWLKAFSVVAKLCILDVCGDRNYASQ